MKLTRTNLGNLTNGAWVTYLTFVVKLIKQNEAVKTALALLLALLEKNLADAEASLEVMRGSQLSRDINEADALRDRMIGGLNNYVRSFLYDADPAKARAAENLIRVINHYSGIAEAPQDQESAMIIDLIRELDTNHQADMEAIALANRKDQLQQANSRFIELLDSRTIETGNRTPLRMVDVRREGSRLIRMLYTQVEMLLLTSPTEAVAQFAAELNAENSRVNANLNRRGEKKTDTAG